MKSRVPKDEPDGQLAGREKRRIFGDTYQGGGKHIYGHSYLMEPETAKETVGSQEKELSLHEYMGYRGYMYLYFWSNARNIEKADH